MIIDYNTDSLNFKVGDFVLTFPTNIRFETYNVPENYYGLIFFHNNYKYDIVDCKLGTRIIINGREGDSKDMPFNLGTAEFLPDCVKVKKVENEKSTRHS
jgi:hypothetical protein